MGAAVALESKEAVEHLLLRGTTTTVVEQKSEIGDRCVSLLTDRLWVFVQMKCSEGENLTGWKNTYSSAKKGAGCPHPLEPQRGVIRIPWVLVLLDIQLQMLLLAFRS